MIVEPSWCHEDCRRKRTSRELVNCYSHRAAVRIVDGDCNAWPPAAFVVQAIERNDIGLGDKKVELRSKIPLPNEEPRLARGARTLGNDAVIRQYETFCAHATLSDPPNGRRRQCRLPGPL